MEKKTDFSVLERFEPLRGSKDPPAIYARKLILLFLRYVFSTHKIGEYHYSEDENRTNIHIVDAFYEDEMKFPSLVVSRGAIEPYGGFSNESLAVTDKGLEIHSMLLAVPIQVIARAREPLECELLASYVSRLFNYYRDVIRRHTSGVYRVTVGSCDRAELNGLVYWQCPVTLVLLLQESWIEGPVTLAEVLEREEKTHEEIRGYNIPVHDFEKIDLEG